MRILPLVAVVAGLAGQATSPWMKWVEEDVVSIVRARRDPTPGTEKNEFKEEHYRRIAWVGDRIGYGELYRYLEGRGRNVIFTFGRK